MPFASVGRKIEMGNAAEIIEMPLAFRVYSDYV
jgi:hypothetical protein